MLRRVVRKQTPLSSSCLKCWDRAPMERYRIQILTITAETWMSRHNSWRGNVSESRFSQIHWIRGQGQISVDTTSLKITHDTRPNADCYLQAFSTCLANPGYLLQWGRTSSAVLHVYSITVTPLGLSFKMWLQWFHYIYQDFTHTLYGQNYVHTRVWLVNISFKNHGH